MSSIVTPNEAVEAGTFIYMGRTGPFSDVLGKWAYVSAVMRNGLGKWYFLVVLADGTLTGVWGDAANQLVYTDGVPDEFTESEVSDRVERMETTISGLQASIKRLRAVYASTPENPYRES